MKSGKKVAAMTALVLACAPVVAEATVYFSDTFDAGTSGTRYDGYAQDNDPDVEPVGQIADLANPEAHTKIIVEPWR